MSGMEVLVPAIGLGFLWIISNQKKKEGFDIANKKILSGDKIIPENYPFEESKLNNVFKQKIRGNNIKQYHTSDDSTKQYYKLDEDGRNNYVTNFTTRKSHNEVGGKKTESTYSNNFTTLTGETVKADKLKHNNMVPWIKSKSYSRSEQSEKILDSYSGSGSQFIEKRAQAPLFKPEKNMTFISGTPSATQYIQQRINPSQKISGIKPFESIYVGPGLDKGYTAEGYGGFNSALDSRDKYMPKGVDELRTANNPKLTLKGNFGAPPSFPVKNIGIQPKMVKQRPDTSFENSPERWFTTTGAEKAQTLRSEKILKYENRSDTSAGYFGAPKDQTEAAIYANRKYLPDKRQDLPTNPLGNASRSNIWDSEKNDYGKDGFVSLPNSRSLTTENSRLENVSRGMWAAVTPVLDALRPSKKMNVIGNARRVGNPSGGIIKQTIYNRHQEPKSTIKEQFVENRHVPYGRREHRVGGGTQNYNIKNQQRDSTQHQYTANISSSSRYSQPQNYTAINNQRNNNKDMLLANRANGGNMKLVNGHMNVLSRKEPLICQEEFRPPNMPKSAPTMQAMGVQSNRPSKQVPNYNRNNSNLLGALANNPYSKPFDSVASY